MVKDKSDAASDTPIDICAPASRRESISRPFWSRPNQCAADGASNGAPTISSCPKGAIVGPRANRMMLMEMMNRPTQAVGVIELIVFIEDASNAD
ncbi:hypothetical protein D3C80_1936200 [compost metagenome]